MTLWCSPHIQSDHMQNADLRWSCSATWCVSANVSECMNFVVSRGIKQVRFQILVGKVKDFFFKFIAEQVNIKGRPPAITSIDYDNISAISVTVITIVFRWQCEHNTGLLLSLAVFVRASFPIKQRQSDCFLGLKLKASMVWGTFTTFQL